MERSDSESFISSIEFFYDDIHLLISYPHRFEIWNILTETCEQVIPWSQPLPSAVSVATVFPFDYSFVAAGTRGVAIVYNLIGHEKQRYYHPQIYIDYHDPSLPEDDWIVGAAISSNQKYLATSAMQQGICLWDIIDGKLLYRKPCSLENWIYEWHQPNKLMFTNKDQFLVSGDIFGDTLIWQVNTGTVFHNLIHLKDWKFIPEWGDAILCDMSILPLSNHRYLLLCIDTLYLCHTVSGQVLGAIDPPEATQYRHLEARISKDATILVTNSLYGKDEIPVFLIWDVRTLTIKHKLYQPYLVWTLSASGQWLIFGSNELHLFNTHEGKPVKKISLNKLD